MPDGWFTPWRVAIFMGLLVVIRLLVSLSLEPSKTRKSVIEVLDSALIALGLVFLVIRPLIVQAFFIPTGSMEPTLFGASDHGVGDRVLVCKFLYSIDPPQRGDIIVFEAPRLALASEGPGAELAPQDFIKRLIGLPGDRIEIRAFDGVYVNGHRLREPYIRSEDQVVDYDFPGPGREYVVPPGKVFVMGDNRNDSNDSHVWGPLPLSNIVGKAMAIFWPPGRMRILH